MEPRYHRRVSSLFSFLLLRYTPVGIAHGLDADIFSHDLTRHYRDTTVVYDDKNGAKILMHVCSAKLPLYNTTLHPLPITP